MLYREFRSQKDLDKYALSLQLYTDRVPLFKSSTTSIWPIYYVMNELPHELLHTPFVTDALERVTFEGKKRGESGEGVVKNGEGKTEKSKMFPIFGGLPKLLFKENLDELLKGYKRTCKFAFRKIKL